MRSSSARSSGLGCQRSAATLARDLLGLRRPGDHRADRGLGGEAGDGDVEQADPARGGERLQPRHRLELLHRCPPVGRPGASPRGRPRRAGTCRSAALWRAGRRAGSRARSARRRGAITDSIPRCSRLYSFWTLTKRVRPPSRDSPLGLLEFGGADVGAADRPHHAFADQLVERGQGLGQRRRRVGVVVLVEVDAVGLQPPQRALDRPADVLARARAALPGRPRSPASSQPELGRQQELVAAPRAASRRSGARCRRRRRRCRRCRGR